MKIGDVVTIAAPSDPKLHGERFELLEETEVEVPGGRRTDREPAWRMRSLRDGHERCFTLQHFAAGVVNP